MPLKPEVLARQVVGYGQFHHRGDDLQAARVQAYVAHQPTFFNDSLTEYPSCAAMFTKASSVNLRVRFLKSSFMLPS
jgi:hypothetical protein